MDGLRRHQERNPAAGDRPLHAARAADLVNAQNTIKRLKGEARELNRKLDAGLAAQIEIRDEKRLRQLYEHRGQEIERLLAQNADLLRTVSQLREQVRSLEDDLAVERTAIRELMGQPANVTSIRFSDR
jgi:archaellum component FlaC